MVFCNLAEEIVHEAEDAVTILILIDGFLQYPNGVMVIIIIDGHNPYFNRWFSAITLEYACKCITDLSQSLF